VLWHIGRVRERGNTRSDSDRVCRIPVALRGKPGGRAPRRPGLRDSRGRLWTESSGRIQSHLPVHFGRSSRDGNRPQIDAVYRLLGEASCLKSRQGADCWGSAFGHAVTGGNTAFPEG